MQNETNEAVKIYCNDSTANILGDLKNVSPNSVILIDMKGKVNNEFDYQNYIDRCKYIIKLCKVLCLDNKIVIMCNNYNSLKKCDLKDVYVTYNSNPVSSDIPTIQEVNDINNYYDLMVQDIKESNMSELEKFIACYKIVTNFKPYTSNMYRNNNIENLPLHTFYGKYIVCGGYCNMLMELLDRVGIKSKYCRFSPSGEKVEKTGDIAGHARLLVRLTDDNTSGYYVCDPTIDVMLRYYNEEDYLYKVKKDKGYIALKILYGKDFDISKIEEYLYELDHNLIKRKQFKNILNKICDSGEDRLLRALLGATLSEKIELEKLKRKIEFYKSTKKLDDFFEKIRKINKGSNYQKSELITKKYEEIGYENIPMFRCKVDKFSGVLKSFSDIKKIDKGMYDCNDAFFLEFENESEFYRNIYDAIMQVGNNKYVLDELCDILSTIFPIEFKYLLNKYPKALKNMVKPDSEFKDFIEEVFRLLLLNNNRSLRLEDIVTAASNVEERIFNLDKNQKMRYYDKTYNVNKKMRDM